MRTRIVLAAFVLGLASVGVATAAVVSTWTASLRASEEVALVPVESNARGQAVLQLSADGSELHYRLIVANIENVTQAHIHMAPRGANGAVVAWLYPDGPPTQLIPGRSSGILATGTITAASLVGPLAGEPLGSLVDAIAAGNAYVNVHTTQYPPGEIRGQVK
jgi:hypothetical protein